MILLLSRKDDGSTKEVAEWLYQMGKKFLRVNADDKSTKVTSIDLIEESLSIRIDGQENKMLTDDIRSVWHRRSGLSQSAFVSEVNEWDFLVKKGIPVKAHIKRENQEVIDYLYYLLETNKNIQHIGSQTYNSVNKLKVLKIAQNCGLNIPNSYLVSEKKNLKQLCASKKMITKAIGNGVYEFTDKYGYYSYTERITTDFINGLPETFHPSLVQEEIQKKYELRIFYIQKQFYSMAIFSQELPQTITDSRKGFSSKFMPRRGPYQLPKRIEKHLILLMKNLNLNTGSIDLVVSKKNEFFFLEVNPVGQFGMTSKPCNYYLEKKLAECL